MTGREFLFLWLGMSLGAAAARRSARASRPAGGLHIPVPERPSAAPRRGQAPAWPLVAVVVAMASAMVATVALVALYGLVIGGVPPAGLMVAVTVTVALGSTLFVWAAMNPYSAGRLAGRLGLSWSAAVAAWSEPIHDGGKPSPGIDRDLA